MRLIEFAASCAVLTTLTFASVGQSQIITQDFESGTVLPADTFFTHDGSGFFGPSDDLSAEGLPLVTAFAGAGGGSVGSASAALGLTATGGVGGSQAATLTLFDDGTTGFSFAGVQQEVGAVGIPTDFSVFANVLAPVGVPLSLRLESPFTGANNGFEFNFVGTGAFQTVGGVVGTDLTSIGGGAFDPAATSNILVATQIGGAIEPTGGLFDVIVDNLSIAPTASAVPEPGSLALLAGLLPMFALRRRKS